MMDTSSSPSVSLITAERVSAAPLLSPWREREGEGTVIAIDLRRRGRRRRRSPAGWWWEFLLDPHRSSLGSDTNNWPWSPSGALHSSCCSIHSGAAEDKLINQLTIKVNQFDSHHYLLVTKPLRQDAFKGG